MSLLFSKYQKLKVTEIGSAQDQQSLKTHYDNTIGGLKKAKVKEHITNSGCAEIDRKNFNAALKVPSINKLISKQGLVK